MSWGGQEASWLFQLQAGGPRLLSLLPSPVLPSPPSLLPSPSAELSPFLGAPLALQQLPTANQGAASSPTDAGGGGIGFPIELVWKTRFTALFAGFGAQFGHAWSLAPAADAPPGLGWLPFHDDAKIRFDCFDCGNGWTSMKGRVAFWYGLFPSTTLGYLGEGFVLFKLFGQRCRKCNSETFQRPLWYPKEVEKVVWNVYSRVCETVYQIPLQSQCIIRERRLGKPQREHVNTDCEACSLGICSSGNNSNALSQVPQV